MHVKAPMVPAMAWLERGPLVRAIPEAAMDSESLHDLAVRLERSVTLDDGLAAEAIAVLHRMWPNSLVATASLSSTDAVLHLVDHFLPEWSISLAGTADAAHGRWVCSLRQSDVHDSDRFLGIGRGPVLAHALAAALFAALAMQAKA